MTPHELAEKILSLSVRTGQFHLFEAELKEIESLLSSALNEASAGMQTTMTDMMNRRIEEAKAAAYEECAKIAESRPTGAADDGMVVQSDIAATIRQQAKQTI